MRAMGFRDWVRGIVLALVAMPCACKREAQPKPQASAVPSVIPAAYKPSSEAGISLPTNAAMTASWSGKRVILEKRGGGVGVAGPLQGGGLYVTEDGFVFSYAYELPIAMTGSVQSCDFRRFKAGSSERYACLHRDSKLRARFEPSLLNSLKLDLARVAESERVEVQLRGRDGGSSTLEVPGRRDDGTPLEIASCNNEGVWQLSSPESDRIFSVFRRLRRALGGPWRFVGTCQDFWEPRKEIFPGRLAWWAYEE
jgi:hypothetical protein